MQYEQQLQYRTEQTQELAIHILKVLLELHWKILVFSLYSPATGNNSLIILPAAYYLMHYVWV